MNNRVTEEKGARLEKVISYILVAGVIASLALLVSGLFFFHLKFGNLNVSNDRAVYIQGKDFFTFIADQFRGTSAPVSLRLITLGILALMLTPYIRVVISALYFGLQKNLKFVVLTVFVLVVLTISLTLH